MAYQQVRAFNPANGGSTLGLCLQNVRFGYSIGAKYASATEAWNHTQQHTNRNIPTGVDVPLYYSWTGTVAGVKKNWGHINVRLADGRVWNDGRIYASLSSFEAVAPISPKPVYLGWGESINDVKVIEGVSMDNVDRGGLETIWKMALDRVPTADEYKNFVGKGWAAVLFTAISSDEYKKRYAGLVKNWDIVTNQVPKLQQQIKDLQAQVDAGSGSLPSGTYLKIDDSDIVKV